MPPARPTVMLLRTVDRRDDLLARLRVDGGRVIDAAISRHAPVDEAEFAPLDAFLRGDTRCDIVVFTSGEGVRAFADRGVALGTSAAAALAAPLVAVVGPATGRALEEAGRRPDREAVERRAEGVVAALRGDVTAPAASAGATHILLVRAREGRPELPEGLEALGARVTLAPVYRTIIDPVAVDQAVADLERHAVDLLVATSGRPLAALGEAVLRRGGGAARPPVAALGPVTALAARNAGFPVALVAPETDLDALVSAVGSYLRKEQS